MANRASFLTAAFLLASAAGALAQEPPSVREVTVAIPRHFPPEYHLDEKGRPGGFAVDVMEEVAKRANLRVHYRVEDNWIDVMAAVRDRRADLIPNLGITETRRRDFDFSLPVETFPVSVFVRRDYDQVRSIDDLPGRRVAVMAGNVAVDLLKGRRGVELVVHPSLEESIFSLLTGEADALVAPAPPVLDLAREVRVEDRIKAVGAPLVEIKRAMAVRKGDAELLARLNRAIEPFADSAEYRAIYIRWHAPPAPFWTAARVGWLFGALLLAMLLGMALWRHYAVVTLNRRLEQQLDELRRFQKLTVRRELRMKELREEIALLRSRLGESPDGGKAPGVAELASHEREVLPHENDERRRGLLALLEDLEANRAKIEQAQREWNAAFDAVADPIFLHDKDFRIARANRAYAARAGLPFQEIIGKPYWQVFPKGTGPLAACRRAMESATEEEAGEEELRLETGEVFQSRSFPVRGTGGAWLFGVHVLQNVTEKRRSEKALRESEEKFHRITAAAQDAILLMDNDGCVVFWNAAAERIFGYTAQEVMGQALHPLLAPERYHADHRNGFARFRDTGEGTVIGKTLELVARHKDGAEFPIELSVSALKLGDRWHAVGVLRDITARKQAEMELTLFRTLLDNSNDAVEVIDPVTLRFLDVNEKECRELGYSREELLSMVVPDIDPTFGQATMKTIDEQIRQSGVALFERSHRRKNGSLFPVEIGLKFVEIGGKTYALSVARDITARKQAEEAVRASHDLLQSVVENIPIRVFWKDRNSRYLGCNNAFARDAGLSRPEDLLGKDDFQMGWRDLADLYRADDKRVMDSDTPKLNFEEPLTGPDGRARWLRTSKVPLHETNGKVFGVLGIYEDITEHRRAAAALEHSEANLAEAQRIAHLGSWELDLAINKLTWSNEIYRIFELNPKEFGASYDAFLAAIHPDDREAVDQAYTEHVKKRVPYDIVHRLIFKDGRIKYVHERCETAYDDAGKALHSVGTVQDVTERRLAEITLAKVVRALRILSNSNEALIHTADESSLLQEVCRIIVEVGGYRMAMVAFAEQDEAKTLRPVAHAGFEAGYAELAKLSWSADTERGRGPGGIAVRTGQSCMARDIPTDPAFAPWRDEALRRGYRSVIALPLKSEDWTFGVLGIYSSETGAFDTDEIEILKELAADLAYGVGNLRVHGEQTRSAERLRQSLVDTIRAIALTVEKRDPYTAGHQNKVAKLCVAIGREMGMDENRLEGMGLAATIHDIGKVYIPAEILNRPGKLTTPEFEIIKSHPEVGYDIIKDVKFPWPVGEMILQHHERLDGSGYPKGLKGDDIILEARILAVADVIDAMSSHRPYRPALGIETALAEIEKRRGTWYDAAVVDACGKVIREGRFRSDAT